MFRKINHNEIFHYRWNKKRKLDSVGGGFLAGVFWDLARCLNLGTINISLANLIDVIIVNITLVEVDIIIHIFTSLFIDFGCKCTTVSSIKAASQASQSALT